MRLYGSFQVSDNVILMKARPYMRGKTDNKTSTRVSLKNDLHMSF